MRSIAFAPLAFGFCITVPASGQSASKDPAQAQAGSYIVEAKHTQVLFSIMRLGPTNYHGRFDRISGTLTFNSKQPEHSAVSIDIDTASLDTTNDKLNNDLKTIFRVQQFPTAVATK